MVDGSPQGKAMGESFPAVRNSKRRLTGQLREKARPCPDHVSLFPEAGRPPQPHIHRKAPWRPKGSYVKGCSTQRPFGRIHLAKRGMRAQEDPEIHKTWRVNQANQNDCLKETWKEYLIKVIQAAERARLSPRVRTCVYPHALHLFFPRNKYFTLSTTSRLWGNSLLQELKGQGPLSLTTSCFHHSDLASISGWEAKPRCKPRPPKIRTPED